MTQYFKLKIPDRTTFFSVQGQSSDRRDSNVDDKDRRDSNVEDKVLIVHVTALNLKCLWNQFHFVIHEEPEMHGVSLNFPR